MGRPIVELDVTDPSVAADVARVSRSAYLVEASLVGREDFPPVHRTGEDISKSTARFFGLFADGELAAIVELDTGGPDEVDIHSLVTDPRFFRQGMAREVLQYVLDLAPDRAFVVATSTANRVAIALYTSLGFRERRRWTTTDGFHFISLVRSADQPGYST